MAGELERAGIELQVKIVLDSIKAPDFFGELSPEQLKGIIPPLISEAIEILKLIPQFKEQVFVNYFGPSGMARPLLTIDIHENTLFQVSYSKDPTSEDEDLILIKNGKEKINLHTYHFLKRDKATITYSGDISEPERKTDIDNARAVERARNFVSELRLAASY